MSSDTSGSGDLEEESTGVPMPAEGTTEGTTQSTEAGAATQAGPQAEGRRTQLKIVRENIHSLSNDVGSFRKSHEGSIKKLEKQVATLRSELAAQTVSKDVANFRKNHDVSAKRLEKQIAALRSELAALKTSIARDAARSRAKQEATLSRILAKVSAKPAKSKAAKSTKKR